MFIRYVHHRQDSFGTPKWKKFDVEPDARVFNFRETKQIVTDHESCDSIRRERYSCVGASIKMYRSFAYYVFRIYVPTVTTMMVGFFSFWLPPTSYPARIINQRDTNRIINFNLCVGCRL